MSHRAWPAIRSEDYDNWSLRFSDGYTRRANSVVVLGTSTLSVDKKVTYCEKAYAREGLRPAFKIAQFPEAMRLDRVLAGRGYETEGGCHIMTRRIPGLRVEASPEFQIDDALTVWWLESAIRLNGTADRFHGPFEQILRRIQPTHGFASIRHGSTPIALGIAVAERNWFGFFDIVTAPEFRRQGYATHLFTGMTNWGRRQGARHAYLQVMTTNTPAVALYERLGFVRRYQYWYRREAA